MRSIVHVTLESVLAPRVVNGTVSPRREMFLAFDQPVRKYPPATAAHLGDGHFTIIDNIWFSVYSL